MSSPHIFAFIHFLFEIGFLSVTLAGLELTLVDQVRLEHSQKSICLGLLSAEIKVIHHHHHPAAHASCSSLTSNKHGLKLLNGKLQKWRSHKLKITHHCERAS